MKKPPIESKEIIFREYDLKKDPEKLVTYLFDKMNSPEDIRKLRAGDKWLLDPNQVRKRFVAEILGELHATITIEQGLNLWTQHRYRLYAVVTSEQYQGTGLSRLLFDFVCTWIKNHDGKLVLVETWEDNVPARSFYEKLGFIQYGNLPQGLKNRSQEGYVEEILYYLMI